MAVDEEMQAAAKAAADQAAKAVSDASVAVNAKVQEVGPTTVGFIQKYWYVWVGLVAILFVGGLASKGLL